MIKRTAFIFLALIALISCRKQVTAPDNKLLTENHVFVINGTLKNFYPKTIYLNKIIENSYFKIDSASIENQTFSFTGKLDYPERFAFTFKSFSNTAVFIAENTSMEIQIDANSLTDPLITGSPLNDELNSYKNASKKIFKKIEYLFPYFQKARLENDAERLTEIGEDIRKIEDEYRNFSFDYISKNTDSYISAMVLSDHIKSSKADTLRIKKAFQLLSEKVRKSPDSKLVSTFLELH